MRILVLNSGSSSIKYQLFAMPDSAPLARGGIERIGERHAPTRHLWRDATGAARSQHDAMACADHLQGIERIFAHLAAQGLGADLGGIGHRVVHGGERFTRPTRIDDAVLAGIEAMVAFAPVHNTANLAGIRAAIAHAPDTVQVAVFDTAFHQSMPAPAYRYAIPADWYAQHGIRRYGFHGISHCYVSREAARLLPPAHAARRLVILHLGNGASATAVLDGRSVATSMGMTPMAGLIMGTRCGDLDPGVLMHLCRTNGMPLAEIDSRLNRESGLKGLCGANDMREVRANANRGDANAQLALAMYRQRVRDYIGAYAVEMGGLDGIVFTGGIGENDVAMRGEICAGLEWFGIDADSLANQQPSGAPFSFHSPNAKVALWVIPTNEELEIARETAACLTASDGA